MTDEFAWLQGRVMMLRDIINDLKNLDRDLVRVKALLKEYNSLLDRYATEIKLMNKPNWKNQTSSRKRKKAEQ